MLDFLNLSVFACCTLYFSTALVFILCILSFSGKRSFKLLCFIPFFASFRHNICLRSSSESRSSKFGTNIKSGHVESSWDRSNQVMTGKRSFKLLCFIPFFANFRHKICLRSSSESKLSIIFAFS